MSLGAHLVGLRERRDIGRKELARKTGLSLSYLHYVENDRTIPGLDKLELIAKRLGLSPAEKGALVEERQIAELRRLGVARPEVTILLNRLGDRISEEDYQRLLTEIAELASG